MPLRVAQIGAGRFSRLAHGPALARLAGGVRAPIALDAVCDLDEGRPDRARQFGRDFGYRTAFPSYQELLAKAEPDLFIVSVAPPRTAAVLADLLPRGIPIFTEKPPALTAADAERLVETAAAAGTLVYVGFNRRRMPCVEFLKQWSERHGPVRSFAATMLRQRRADPHFAITATIHAVDTLRYLGGDVVELHARRWAPARGRGATDAVRLCFVSGALGAITVQTESDATVETYAAEAGRSRVEVTVCAPYSLPPVWAGTRVYEDNVLVLERPAAPEFPVAAGILPEHEAFVLHATTASSPDCSLRDAVESMRLTAAIESGFAGSWRAAA